MDNISMSGEDYVEAIYVLGKEGAVKSTDVAVMLRVSRPAVNKAMAELASKGLVVKQAYGKITLTPDGLSVARKVYSRHTLLHDFLTMLGVSEKTAALDCCKIEHFVSEETINKISEFMDRYKNNSK